MAVCEILDMPDRRASLFVRMGLQNDDRLVSSRRATFAELTDAASKRLSAAQCTVTVRTSASEDR